MSEREYNEIFAENLKRYLDLNDMSQTDLARRLGVSAQSVTNWCSGKKSPRMDKVDAMCAIFNCNRSDLMEVQTSGHPEWYDYPKTTKYMEAILDKPGLGVLLEGAMELPDENVDLLLSMIEAMKGTNPDG